MEDFDLNDTIVAQITPLGVGSVAIVRLSGRDAISLANGVFSKDLHKAPSNRVLFGKVQDSNQFIDEAIVVVMRNPNSFTGEDVVEFQCHGSQLIVKEILKLLTNKGARLAKPGEFSFRAFIHGKMDLMKAESISEVIQAKSQEALALAKNHLQGDLNHEIESMQKDLLDIVAQTEAFVDFPEEDLDFASNQELVDQLQALLAKIKKLIGSFEQGKKIFHGVKLALIGAPNVGKSSLMNALLKENRAIVTDIAGTTRDLITEQIEIAGHLVTLIDTAGIRKTKDQIETIGVEKSMEVIEQADFILYIIDISNPENEKIQKLSLQFPKEKTICVLNKCDLKPIEHHVEFETVSISAKHNQNLDQLLQVLTEKIEMQLPDKQETLLSSQRHKALLQKTCEHLLSALAGFEKNCSYEFICLDLRLALDAICAISGKKVGEDIIDAIFSKFCLGK